MRTWRIIPLIFFTACCSVAQAQPIEKIIQSGNDLYQQQQYDKAAAAYSEAVKKDSANATARFNLGNALYKQHEQDEAVKLFTEMAPSIKEAELRSKVYYNKGVVLSRQQKLEESIEAYKNALRQNPEDKDARENLQKALLELKKKTPPKKEKNESKKKKKEEQQKQQPQSKMSQKEAEQRLKLLEQKEKEVQQRLQQDKSKTGGGQPKDW